MTSCANHHITSAKCGVPWPISLGPPKVAEICTAYALFKCHRPQSQTACHQLCSKFRIRYSEGADAYVFVWVEEKVPSDWMESIVIPVLKILTLSTVGASTHLPETNRCRFLGHRSSFEFNGQDHSVRLFVEIWCAWKVYNSRQIPLPSYF